MTEKTATFAAVAIADLVEAPYNPRKTFDDESLKELVESVKSKGVLTPLLVRPLKGNGHYEIIGGARRFRAAKKAGLKDVPCQIRELSDDEALEVAILDNLQRHDVSPIEEAHGFQAWLDRGHKPEELAKKIGKSVRYVYGRLELRSAAPDVVAAMERGEITATHAGLIATLADKKDQAEALRLCFVEAWPRGGEGEHLIEVHERAKATIGVRDLQKRVTALKLGAEVTQKIAGLEAQKVPCCIIGSDAYYSVKSVHGIGTWRRQDPKKPPCGSSKVGVFLDGKDRLKTIDVCIDRKCEQHFPQPKTTPSPDVKRERTPAEQKAEAARLFKAKVEEETKDRLFKEVCRRVPDKLGPIELRAIAERFDNMPDEIAAKDLRLKTLAIARLNPSELVRYIVGVILCDSIDYDGGRLVERLASAYKINVKALREAATEEIASPLKWEIHGQRATAKCKNATYVYTVRPHKFGPKGLKRFEFSRSGTGEGLLGSTSMLTMRDAMRAAEKAEIERLGGQQRGTNGRKGGAK